MKRLNGESMVWAALLLALATFKCAQHQGFETNAFDVGVYSNVAWNVAHGHGFHSSFNGLNQLGEHFSPIVALFAPLYGFWPSAQILMLAQAFAVWLTIFLIYRLADVLAADLSTDDRAWLRATCACMALFYLPLQQAFVFEFHPSTLGMPLIAAAILFLHQRRIHLFWLSMLLLLSTKELAFLSTVGIGLYAGLVLKQRRLMCGLVGLSLVLAAGYFVWLQPYLRSGAQWFHYERVDILGYPRWKLLYVILLGVYFGLLPFLGGRALIAAAPTTSLNLIVGKYDQFSFKAHYDDQNCVFWIIAGIHGLLFAYRWMRTHLIRFPWPSLRRKATLLLISAALLASIGKIAGAVGNVWPRSSDRELHARLQPYVKLPPETGIYTQNGFGAQLCHRERCLLLNDKPLSSQSIQPGEYVILSTWVSHYLLDDLERALRTLEADPGFKKIEANEYLSVFQRQ